MTLGGCQGRVFLKQERQVNRRRSGLMDLRKEKRTLENNMKVPQKTKNGITI